MGKRKADKNIETTVTDNSFLEIAFRFTGGDVPEEATVSVRQSEGAVPSLQTFNLNTETGRRKCCYELYRLYDMAVVEACRWNTAEADDFLSGL